MRLADHAVAGWGQFGEDGIIEKIFQLIGIRSRFCVEFGAGDGVVCSNTKKLREHGGWAALLIEANPELYQQLVAKNARPDVQCLCETVTPGNIDALVTAAVDLMSIDVDGDDYAIFAAMQTHPRVLCIEYNQSVPAHMSLRQRVLGQKFGASALALCQLAERKGYGLVGLTKGNLLFVGQAELGAFDGYERRLEMLFDHSALTYLATDQTGAPMILGAEPPWGLRPYPSIVETEGVEARLASRAPADLRVGFESVYGPAVLLRCGQDQDFPSGPDARRSQLLRAVLEDRPPLVVIDITNHGPSTTFKWIQREAQTQGYRCRIIEGSLIVLLHGG